ncbi:MAG: GldG family protein [Defluviitaleaceae bacterium]|nr:GldG family protein [Defluviitaleaceae bacterium]
MQLLKDKRFRYGTFSTVMLILAVIMFLLVNLLAGAFDRSRDLTNEQLFSLSDESRDFLENLENDVTITLIARHGQEHTSVPMISRITNHLLVEYAAASPRVRVETRDPMLNPALVHHFASDAGIEDGISEHSVVVQSGNEIRVVQPHEMINMEFNPFTGASRVVSYNIEREITRAIHHVTQGAAAVVYVVSGSGEPPLPSQFIAFLEAENFVMREVNLVLSDVPETADILFIPMPTRDWTELKADRVLAFLEDEGSAFFALDFLSEATPNLTRVLNAYGLGLGQELIIEDNPNNVFPARNAPVIVPNIVMHDVTENLQVRNFANLVPFFPVELQIEDVRRTTLTIEPLWLTSRDAFSRGLDADVETLARVPEDTAGPFTLAAAVTDRIFIDGTAYYTQIVATSNFSFINTYYTSYVGEGNWHFVLNSLRWMINQPTGIWIPVRMPAGQMPLLITDGAVNIISGIAMGGLPLICLGIGAFIWFKRRHS